MNLQTLVSARNPTAGPPNRKLNPATNKLPFMKFSVLISIKPLIFWNFTDGIKGVGEGQ